MVRLLPITLMLASAVGVFALITEDADGCAAIGRVDRNDPPIIISEEAALIVWDPVNKVEHFIRRAAFDTPSPDFAFLVPTPGPDIPVLKEMEDAIFWSLDAWRRPRIVERTQFNFAPLLTFPFTLSKGLRDEAPGGVRVLGEQKVGGFDAVILEADRTDELSGWLKKNRYSNDPQLQSWLAPYVLNNWKITAFKISQDPKSGQLATTKPVRMSFKTDKPFFPYREPEGKKVEGHFKSDIDGIWKVESMQGEDAAKWKGTRLEFVNGVAVGTHVKDAKFTTDVRKNPKWLDVGDHLGIFRLDDQGDTLHWCRSVGRRPQEFDCTKAGTLLVLRRDRDAEDDRAKAEGKRERDSARTLRVFFLSSERMTGKVGAAAWHGLVKWADVLTEEQRRQVVAESGLSDKDVPEKAWLTVFEDHASPRPGTEDVYFVKSENQATVRPPDFVRINEIWIPGDCLFVGLCLLFGLAAFVIIKRRRRPAPAAQSN